MTERMIIVDLVQGSPEWEEHREKHRNASEAPVVMGVSPYKTREELLRQKYTGEREEHNKATLALFARGHEAERLSRPLAEKHIGEDLYPVVAVRGQMGASFDGITLLEDTVWECKLWNETKAEDVRNGQVPERDYWQLIHQFYVSGAERVIYTVTDGTEEKTLHLEVKRDATIENDIKRLLAGWVQFEKDLADYEPQMKKAEVVGESDVELPLLNIRINGMVEQSNLDQFEKQAIAMIKSINRELVTDQHFADAKETVKKLKKAEDAIAEKREEILKDAESIHNVFETLDRVQEECRNARLELNRYVTTEEKARKEAIQREAEQDFNQHITKLQNALGMPVGGVVCDVAGAMKGKRTITTLEDAAKAEAARAKTEATMVFEQLKASLDALAPFMETHAFLFSDKADLVHQAPEAVAAIAKQRISEHEAAMKAEAERKAELERERIRAEEEAKARREAEQKLKAEQAETKPTPLHGAHGAVAYDAEGNKPAPQTTIEPAPARAIDKFTVVKLVANHYGITNAEAEQALISMFKA